MRRIHSCELWACAARIRRTRRRSRSNDVELGMGLPSSGSTFDARDGRGIPRCGLGASKPTVPLLNGATTQPMDALG
jgi:hypothetical protein